MADVLRTIGLMSGTSMDGIDIALLETDGERHLRRGPSETHRYPDDFRARLRVALEEARSISRRDERPGSLAAVEAELTQRHADAVLRFMGDRALQPFAIDTIGFHGHTVLHRPDTALTVQIGDGAALAAATGVKVVHDMRAADVTAGGQGAPLAPAYHRALVARLPERPVAVLNIGGVANVTWIGRRQTAGEEALIAFDTGPGNALLDDWTMHHTGEPFDEDGALAASGRVDDDIVAHFLRHPHFARLPPKSLDRNAFDMAPLAGLSVADGAATLAHVTAATIAASRAHLPEEPAVWLVSGGGRRNRAIMQALAGAVHGAVAPIETLGLDGDSIEAEAWAYLAVRALRGLPLTYPGTTGVAAPTTGGVVCDP